MMKVVRWPWNAQILGGSQRQEGSAISWNSLATLNTSNHTMKPLHKDYLIAEAVSNNKNTMYKTTFSNIQVYSDAGDRFISHWQ